LEIIIIIPLERYFIILKSFKSILDYVLKDDLEATRLGIMEIIDPILDYG